MKPFRLLDDSLKKFVFGLVPAFGMALVCLVIQIVLWRALIFVHGALFPSKPFDLILAREYDWRDRVAELFGYTAGISSVFFFHALVALLLTAWLLRARAGFHLPRVLRRAARGAGLLTCAAAILFAFAFVIENVLPPTREPRFDFNAVTVLILWFAASALLLPARLMGHQPDTSSGWLQTTLVAAVVLLPFFFLSEIVGGPLRRCRECWGLFEGGLFTIPLLGAYLLGLTVTSAAVSAAACEPGR